VDFGAKLICGWALELGGYVRRQWVTPHFVVDNAEERFLASLGLTILLPSGLRFEFWRSRYL